MRPFRLVCTIAVALVGAGFIPPSSSLAHAQGAKRSRLSGTYLSPNGSLTVAQHGERISASGSVGGVSGTLEGDVQGDHLSGTFRTTAGGTGAFFGRITPGGFELSFQGGAPVVFQRQGRDHRREEPQREDADSREETPSAEAVAPAAGGSVYRAEYDGWRASAPQGWKYAVQGPRVIFGSDTEAGVIAAWLAPGVGARQLRAQTEDGARRLGVTLTGAPIERRLPGGPAVIAEFSGRLPDGTFAKGRAIGVAGAPGAVVLVGLTTPEHFANLARRVDALARSVGFFRPKRRPLVQSLVGAWWHWHSVGSSSASHESERTLVLCPDGSFQDSSASSTSINTETRVGQSADLLGNAYDTVRSSAYANNTGGGAGRWQASGDNARGVIELHFANGNVERHQYRFERPGGGDIYLDQTWYGRNPDKYRGCR